MVSDFLVVADWETPESQSAGKQVLWKVVAAIREDEAKPRPRDGGSSWTSGSS